MTGVTRRLLLMPLGQKMDIFLDWYFFSLKEQSIFE